MLRLALLALFVIVKSFAEVAEEEGVLVLTKDNFEQVISENEYVLVEFYAPWCGHCKSLAPEYAKAAQALKEEDSPIKLAKVDATVEEALAAEYEVTGFPILKFFSSGIVSDYKGGRNSAGIIKWLKFWTAPPAEELNTKEELEEFKQKEEVVVIGFFKDQESDEAKEFIKIASELRRIPFGITSNSDLFDDNDLKTDKVVLFKKFDEGRNDFQGELTKDDIVSFIDVNRLPIVVEYNKETARKVFGGMITNHLLLFLEKEKHEDIIERFGAVAKDFKGQVLFIYLDAAQENNTQFMESLGLEEDQVPALRLVDMGKDKYKYKPESRGVAADDIRKFVQDYLDGKLEPYLMSAALPDDWDVEPVKVLVGKNFKKVALDESKAVLVHFYVPECEECEQLAPIWEELAASYEDIENIVIAKMDSKANKVVELEVKDNFPTLKFFPADSDDIIDYDGERTLDAFKAFLDSNVEIEAKESKKKVEKENKKEAKKEDKKEAKKEDKKKAKKEDKKEAKKEDKKTEEKEDKKKGKKDVSKEEL